MDWAPSSRGIRAVARNASSSAVEGPPAPALLAIGRRPAAFEGFRRIGIGNRVGGLAGLETLEARELATPPFAHGLRELAVMVGEVEEGRAAGALLAHEDQRDLRAQQLQGDGRLQRLGIGVVHQTVAERAVADLVVVLQEEHEGGGREVIARRAARLAVAIGRALALIGEALGQAAGQHVGRRHGIVGIVAVALAGQQDMQDVVRIVVPLRVEVAAQMRCDIAVVLEHEMDMAAGFDGGAHLGRHLVEPVRFARWRGRHRSAGRRSDIPAASRARSR